MSSLIIKKVDNNISCLQKLKKNEDKMKNKMNDFMKKTNLFNYEETIESLVKGTEQQLISIKNKCDNMNKILNSEDVVITIFGSVSVGKSYLMNVLLSDKIFLSSAAHSTSCFVSVKKGDDNCLMYSNEKEYFDNVKDMKDKFNELTSSLRKTDKTLQNKDTLEIIIKETSSTILKSNVAIVDTPGADRNININNAIKNTTQDSDIFIFILNCNITDVDRGFFDYQTETSVRPDIFILINKWDNTDDDDDEDTEDSKLSITEECSSFIRKQRGGNMENVESQIYFISTREILDIKTKSQNYQNLTPKQQQRYDAFVKFEEKLQKYIDNREENKKRRYDCDIEELIVKIDGINSKFEDDFKQWKNKSNGLSERLTKLKDDIKELKKELHEFIEEEIKQIKNILDKLAITDVQNINITLNELDKKCELKIIDFFQKKEDSDSFFKENLKNLPRLNLVDHVLENVTLLLSLVMNGPVVPISITPTMGNVYQIDKNITDTLREELKIDVEFVGRKMYYHYDRCLSKINIKIEEGEKYWKDYICELDNPVCELCKTESGRD